MPHHICQICAILQKCTFMATILSHRQMYILKTSIQAKAYIYRHRMIIFHQLVMAYLMAPMSIQLALILFQSRLNKGFI